MGYGIFGQKITGIRDIKTRDIKPLMGPHYGKVCKRMIVEPGNWRQFCAFVSRNCRVFCVLSTTTWDSENQDVFLMILEDFL